MAKVKEPFNSKRHTQDCVKHELVQPGDCAGCAEEAIEAIFSALLNNKSLDFGAFNEVLLFVSKHSKQEK